MILSFILTKARKKTSYVINIMTPLTGYTGSSRGLVCYFFFWIWSKIIIEPLLSNCPRLVIPLPVQVEKRKDLLLSKNMRLCHNGVQVDGERLL